MRNLNYQLKQLCFRNRDGSHATQQNRARMLSLTGDQLFKLGFRKMTVHSLKPKHVQALVDSWKLQGLNPGTIKNRMACIRWWAEKVGKSSVIPRDNTLLGIAERQFSSNVSKGKELSEAKLINVKDEHIRMSLELQKEFGLRREEAIKFIPSYADQGNVVILKGSWTKGGKQREIPILSSSQREVLDKAHRLAGKGSLIPSDRNYVKQLKIYERHTAAAGLSKMHGLRHTYAQQRYFMLAGFESPAAGGLKSSELTKEQKLADKEARLIVSKELGHEREQVTTIYLGR